MTAKRDAEETPEEFFLSHEPLQDLRENDAFGHAHYSHVLLEILERSRGRGSYAVGLFGALGVGKTSIVNELRRLLSDKGSDKKLRHSYDFIVLDAWRYSDENFRREFLLDLAQAFSCRKGIRDRIAKNIAVPKLEYRTPSWGTLLRSVMIIALIVAITALVSRYLGSSETRFAVTLTGILSGFLLATANALAEIFKPVTIVEQTSPPVHPDEFGDVFEDVLEKTRVGNENHRLVVAIDNLDRAPADVVMRVLGAVKSFLNKLGCVYILPCDERGLIRHIRESRSRSEISSPMSDRDATEYLRKFFQVTLTVRELLAEDLEAYIDRMLARLPFLHDRSEDNELGGDGLTSDDTARSNRDAIGLVFRVAVLSNPRQVLHLANKLAASYLLAAERAKAGNRIQDTVLKNLGFLAKLVVIEERWPAFYSLVLSYPDTLRNLRRYFATEDKNLLPYPLGGLLNAGSSDTNDVSRDWESGLKSFLDRTSQIHSDYVSDFLLLKERPAVSQISNYYTFRDAALSGDASRVVELVADDGTEASVAVEELLNELRIRFESGDVPSCLSLISCLVSVGVEERVGLSTGVRERIAEHVASTLAKRNLSTQLPGADLPAALSLLGMQANNPDVTKVIQQLIASLDMEQRSEEAIACVGELIRHPDLLSVRSQSAIAAQLEALAADGDGLASIREVAASAQRIWTDLPCDLLPRVLWEKCIELLGTPGREADEAITFLASFVPCLDEALLGSLCGAAASKLGQPGPNPQTELALKIMGTIPPQLIPSRSRDPLIRGLAASYPTAADQMERGKFLRAFFHMLPSLDATLQTAFMPRFHDYCAKADIDGLLSLMKDMQEIADQLEQLEGVLDVIRARVQAFIEDGGIRSGFFELVEATQCPDQLQSLIRDLWTKSDAIWGDESGVARELLAKAAKVLQREDFRSLVAALLDQSVDVPAGKKVPALSILGAFPESYTKDFLRQLVDKLLNLWLSSGSEEDRRAGVALWQGIREKALDERDRVHERVLEYARQEVNTGTIASKQGRVLVDLLIGERKFMDPNRRSEFIEAVMRLIEEGKPDEVRSYGHTSLRALHSWDEAGKRVPERVLALLEVQRDEPNMRNNLQTLDAYDSRITKQQRNRLDTFLEEHSESSPVKEYQERRAA